MRIKNFTIKMDSERSFSSSETVSEKRESINLQGTTNNQVSREDRVSISRESYAKLRNDKSFIVKSKSIVKRPIESNPSSAVPVVETISKALTGRNTTVTSIMAKTTDERISGRTTNRQAENQNSQTEQIIRISRSYVQKEKEITSFASSGLIKADDGTEISFNLFLELQRGSLKEGQDITIGDSRLLTDPLVINLSGKPPEIADALFSFDIDSDGENDQLHSLGKGTGFLALDKNKDGKINNGSELFGPSSGNGFSDLAALDENSDGWVDENDSSFNDLVIWSKNEEGIDVMSDLKTSGIGALYTGSAAADFSMKDSKGETGGILRRSGLYVMESGEVQSMFQVDLAKEQKITSEVQPAAPRNQETPRQREINSAREAMISSVKESISRMQERIDKMTPSNNKSANPQEELMEKMKQRLEELMKFFDEKMKESFQKTATSKKQYSKGFSTAV